MNFVAVTMEKPSHVYGRGENWILQQLLQKKLAIFIARRKKVNFAAVAKEKLALCVAVRGKVDFAVRKKVYFASLLRKNWPYL